MIEKAELLRVLKHAIEAEEELAFHVAAGLESLLETYSQEEGGDFHIPSRTRLLEIARLIKEDSERHRIEMEEIVSQVSVEDIDAF